jgi:hypothetical protein
MSKVLVSLLCHPERQARVMLEATPLYDVELNTASGYANAVRQSMEHAIGLESDLVLADTDGYHPREEIQRLATFDGEPAFLKPFRDNIGFQSKAYSYLWSAVHLTSVKDVTGGMYRMSLEFMKSLPALRSKDMTIHVEILNRAVRAGVKVEQYPYKAAANDSENSKRTKHYQLKLLKALTR